MMAEKIRVLYVDDEPFLLDVVKKFLEKSGDFIVTTSPGAPEAIRIVGQERFDAIVSDYQMPGMDGIGFLKHLKAEGNTTPFVIITGKGCEEVVIEALDAGADSYIRKSGKPKAHFAELSHKIKKAIESRQVEEDLRKSEEKFRNVFDWANDAILLHTLSTDRALGRFIDVNLVACRMLGYSHEELLAMGPMDIVPPKLHPQLDDIIRQIQTQDTILFETLLRRKDGTIFPVESSGHLVDHEGKKIWISHIRDITERKRAEEALTKARQELMFILDSVPALVWQKDANGRYVLVNKKYCDVVSLSEGDILGRTDHELYPDAIADKYVQDDRKVMASRTDLHGVEERHTLPTGDSGWSLTDKMVWYDSEKIVKGTIGFALDITERKQAEEALRESENKFATIFRSSPVALTLVSALDGTFVDVNDAFVRNTGYSHDEVIGITSETLGIFPDSNERERMVSTIRDQRCVYDMELKCRIKTGEIRTCLFSSGLVLMGGIPYIISTIEDITGRKRAEEALRESEEKYRMLVETLNEGIWVIDKEAVTTYVNPKMAEILGYTIEEMTDRNLFSFMDDEGKQIAECLIERRKQGIKEQHVFEFLKKDGTRIYTSLETTPIKGKEGEYLGAIAGVMDITDQKLAEDALRESEELLRKDLDAMQRLQKLGALFLHDDDINSVLTDIIDAAIAITGADFGNIQLFDLTSFDLKIVAQRGFPGWWLDFWNTVQKGQGSCGTALERGERIIVEDIEQSPIFVGTPALEIQRKAGVRAVQSTPLVGWTGKQLGMFSTHFRTPHRPDERQLQLLNLLANQASDIIDWMQTNTALQESKRELTDIINFFPDATLVIDKHGTVLAWNRAMEEMTGVPAEQMIGKENYEYALPFYHERRPITADLVLKDDPAVSAKYPVMKKKGNSLFSEIFIPHLNNGRGAHLWFMASPLYDADGNISGAIESIRDITERKKMEESLQEANEYLHKLIDFGNAPIIVWNPGFEITLFNQASVHLTGRTEQEVIGQKIDILFPKETREASLALIKKTLDGERWETVEIPILAVDGTISTVLWNTANILTAEAELISTIAQGVDITERKRVEEALRESEAKFRALIEHALEGIMVLDLQGTILFANNATARTLEAGDCAGLIGRNVMEFVAPESREDVAKDFIEVSHGHDAYLAQYNTISAKGNKFTVESIGKVIRYEGKPADLVSIRDITERKQAEDALRESESFNRGLVENLPDYIAIYGTDGNLLYVNPAAATALGYSAEKLVGMPVLSYVAEEYRDVVISKLATRHEGGEVPPYEIEARTHDGLRRSVIVKGTQIQYRDTPATLMVLTDITERKRAEDTIKSALAEKEVLLREIHHRVKNNLAGIISLIDLQIGSVSDPVTISLLQDLETRIRSMALVHESLYRTEDLAHISFTSYTEELTRYLFQVYGTGSDIRCRIDMGDVTMSIENAIPCGLVMNEIITNSLKYAFPNNISCQEIRGEPCIIALTLHREGSDYLLKIADNGTGIPEGNDVTMSHSLGLFLIRFIVEHQLRGSLEICTTGGTAYTIRFPAPEVKERNNDE